MRKIVSLVPSITASLCRLGLREQLIGITNFCNEPADLHRQAEIVGGTKNPNLEQIFRLQADIVFVNSEENRVEDIEALKTRCNVNETFPKSPFDIPKILRSWQECLPEHKNAFMESAKQIEAQLTALTPLREGPSFLYFIWKRPYMVAADDTYISGFLECLGLRNLAPSGEGRYPEVDASLIAELNPDLILLSSEPYPFRNRDWLQLKQETGVKSLPFKADGKLISWHGVHLLDALDDFKSWKFSGQGKLFRPIQQT